MKNFAAVMCLAILGTLPSSANAQNPCWIDRVEEAANGVDIFFISHPLRGTVQRSGEIGGEGFYHDAVRKVIVRREESLDHLFLENGFEVTITHLHSGCKLSIEVGRDQAWLVGYGSNAMPGRPPERRDVRIEVRKRRPKG